MNLQKIFKPKSMAVIGLSLSNPFNPANVIYNKNRHHYRLKTYGVNPKGGQLYGREIHKSIDTIPDKVDLAVISTRADFVPDIVKQCIKKGVSGAVIISGGFTESGRPDLQDKVKKLSIENSFPIIGPNCLGVFSYSMVDTFFLSGERLINMNHGPVSLVSQSGGILVDQLIKLTQEGVGLSRAVSIGNKAVIDEVDLLRYFKKDRDTGVIGLYIEGFKEERGREFIDEVNSSKKPVIVMKSGKTPGGTKAVSSHTASIAGDYVTFSEVVKFSQAVEAKSEIEFVSYCEALSTYPQCRIDNIAIVTASGGHGAIASDGCYTAGLAIPEVPEEDKGELIGKLSRSIQEICSLSNPMDLTGSAVDDDFVEATKYFMEKKDVDCIILLLLPYLPGITNDIGARISELALNYNKPLIAYMPHVDKYGIFIEGFEINGVPVAHSVEGAVHMVKALKRRAQ